MLATALLTRGAIRALRQRYDDARTDLEHALDACAAIDSVVTDRCLAAGFLAVVELCRGQPERAWPLFAEARAQAARWNIPRHARTLDALERCATGELAPDTNAASPRFLEEWAAAALAARLRGPAAFVVVGPELTWIEVPAGDRIELRRRPVLRRLLRALVDAREDDNTPALTTRELVAKVWPGDRSDPATLENRLWVALSAARKLGFAAVISTVDDGYCLRPELELRRAS